MQIKVAMAGLPNDKNLGDPIIMSCAKSVYARVLKGDYGVDATWVDCDLDPSSGCWQNRHKRRLYHKAYHTLLWKNPVWKLCARLALLWDSKAYDDKLEGCEMAMVVGGGIVHFGYLNCGIGMCHFILACYRKKIPVIVNAVGVEGYDAQNSICQLIKYSLGLDNVRAITVRDNESLFKEFYLTARNRQKFIGLSFDPAIFAVLLTPPVKKTEPCVGIGLFRGGHVPIVSEDIAAYLIDFYAGMANAYDAEGVKYRFFTNGLDSDLSLKAQIAKKLGREVDVYVPKTQEELVGFISEFTMIIGVRMHSLIIAYALGVPEIGIAWHEKVLQWSENIKQPDAFYRIDNLSVNEIVEKTKAMLKTANAATERLQEMKKEHIEKVKRCLSNTIPLLFRG